MPTFHQKSANNVNNQDKVKLNYILMFPEKNSFVDSQISNFKIRLLNILKVPKEDIIKCHNEGHEKKVKLNEYAGQDIKRKFSTENNLFLLSEYVI